MTGVSFSSNNKRAKRKWRLSVTTFQSFNFPNAASALQTRPLDLLRQIKFKESSLSFFLSVGGVSQEIPFREIRSRWHQTPLSESRSEAVADSDDKHRCHMLVFCKSHLYFLHSTD
ncbi:hypothetical protein CDAR_385701 [Caerostris darwini]|uniref:Uncharacterized protein n=1 Tax=Caerostris darwini TaxID=1538125 RepID=A0AAV4M4B4_9ARAC|nr:hypothetical protein CDAR_385701 [Caerostris darwini]